MAISYCSAFGALPCQSQSFSMKETPLPLTLWAMMTVGLPLYARAAAKAASSSPKSCAEHSTTFQPKARNLSAEGANLCSFPVEFAFVLCYNGAKDRRDEK